jgi:hypothetical protein
MKYFQLEDSELGTGPIIPAGTDSLSIFNDYYWQLAAKLVDIWKFEGRSLNTFCLLIISDVKGLGPIVEEDGRWLILDRR